MAVLPSLEKTWFYNINNKRANNANLTWHQLLMFDIHKALINDSPAVAWIQQDGTPGVPAGIWAVDHSHGDGGVGSAGDGVDRWGSSASLLWDRPGDTHHWMVYNTGINGGVAQIMLDLDNNNSGTAQGSPESIDARLSYAGDFGSGGAAGTSANAPLPSVLFSEFTRGLALGAWAGNQLSLGQDISWHMMMSSDGEEMRIFMHRNNVCFCMWAVGVLAGFPASATDNIWATIWTSPVNTPREALGMEQGFGDGFFDGGGTILAKQRAVCGSGDLVKLMFLQPVYTTNEISVFKADDLAGQADEREAEQVFTEMHFWDTDTVGVRGPKGRIKDMWLVKDDRQIGDTYPVDGTRMFHHVGQNVAVPWPPIIPQNSF